MRLGAMLLMAAITGCSGASGTPADRPFLDRWVWDSAAVLGAPNGIPNGFMLGPGIRVNTRAAGSGFRLLRIDGREIGFLPESVLHLEPRPRREDAYTYAEIKAQFELSRPHTARFPPADSAEVRYRGNGRFTVSSRLTAEDGAGRAVTVPWFVVLRRVPYRWVVDSIRVDSPYSK